MTECHGADEAGRGSSFALHLAHPYRLPVSAIDIRLSPFAGREELLLAEASALDMTLAVALLDSTALRSDGTVLDWAKLPCTDIDAALLHLRRAVLGDAIRADVVCPSAACGKRIDISFSVGEFLAHHSSRRVRGVEPAADGWFRFADGSATFRPPTGADIAAAATGGDPERELAHRCVRPADLPGSAWRRAVRALEAMAPSLAETLLGECAECGVAVDVYFDARSFALRELRDQAAFIYGDTHMLACHYHWAEADILALPRSRRIHYVDMLAASQGGS